MKNKEKSFIGAGQFSACVFVIPLLALFLSGFAKWSLVFSSLWVPIMAITCHSINKDLAEHYARNETIVIIRKRK